MNASSGAVRLAFLAAVLVAACSRSAPHPISEAASADPAMTPSVRVRSVGEGGRYPPYEAHVRPLGPVRVESSTVTVPLLLPAPSGCRRLGSALEVHRPDTLVAILIDQPLPPDMGCAGMAWSRHLELDVSGVPVGRWQVSVRYRDASGGQEPARVDTVLRLGHVSIE